MWCLPTDFGAVELSKVLYRCVRAIGGGWSEQLHVDSDLVSLAERWRSSQNLSSIPTCPLCQTGPGTPRHVVMSCPAMRPLVDMLRDCLEREMIALVGCDYLLTKAAAWRNVILQRGELHLLGGVEPVHSRRWPILSAWRFLVPILQRVDQSSRAAAAAELPFELGYRAVVSLELGRALCGRGDASLTSSESFSVLQHPAAVQLDVGRETRRKQQLEPAIRFTALLVLGLRRIRVEFAKRV